MLSKKKKIIGGVCLGLAIFAAGGAAYFVMNGSTKNSSVAVSSEENLYADGSGKTSPSGGKNLDVDTSTSENPDVDTSTQTKEKASTQEKSDKKTNADSKNSSVDTSKNKVSDVDTSKKTTDKSDGKNNQKDKTTTQAKAAEKTTEQKSTKQSSTKQPTTQQQSTQQQTTQQPATSQPATTQPATTQPATQQPATSQPATTQPATEAPKQEVAECQHEWVWATKTVIEHHDMVWHEEPKWGSSWKEPVKITVINCSVCGNDYSDITDFEENDHCYGSYSLQERVDHYIEHPAEIIGYTEVIDQEAYDEEKTVNDYEYCSKCGKRK